MRRSGRTTRQRELPALSTSPVLPALPAPTAAPALPAHPGLPALAVRGRSAARARLALTASAVAVLLAVTACGDDADDGQGAATGAAATGAASTADALGPAAPARGEPVRIGLVTGRGASGDLNIEKDVAEATVKYLNEHRSGIAGRPVELVLCETLADPGKGADCGNRMVEENVAAVVVGSTPVLESVWQPINQAGLPAVFFGASGNRILGDTKATFALTDPTFPVSGVPIALAKEHKTTKVTAVVIDVPSSRASYQAAVAVYKAAGIDLTIVPVPLGTADMTPQMRKLAGDDPGVVHIHGNDSFCISALNGLRAVGYDGPISMIGQCVTDATRKAVPASYLEGVSVAANSPIGTDNPSTRLYQAVVTTYGKDIDPSKPSGVNIFTTLAGFQASLANLTGDVTPTSVITAMKAMPATELPGGGGLKIRCNGHAVAGSPAVCGRGGLLTTLDDAGEPTEYKLVGATPIED
ncbi:branched-chain amino acid ABC transporter substrate-binding protein [Frankia sp. R43]|uniref:ABC transporter substrate-binding protein n=1 Tax=Frankia sp. R43 TaxID=269536 RepID=UPI0006CA126D|nr:ABC transporter substrate-binding protein [Frankia sp. R43]KPM52265.1 branched-chain amino acid ABC transporter substrate-binding protein [Frankia sp. R43]